MRSTMIVFTCAELSMSSDMFTFLNIMMSLTVWVSAGGMISLRTYFLRSSLKASDW